jgi:hypothetical protein
MKPWSEFNTLYRIKDIAVDVKVQVYCEQDDLTLDDVIGDAEDKQDLERKIERGDLMIAWIMVKASALGCAGSDSLGGCYVSSPGDVNQYLADYSMIAEACAELEKNILNQAAALSQFTR